MSVLLQLVNIRIGSRRTTHYRCQFRSRHVEYGLAIGSSPCGIAATTGTFVRDGYLLDPVPHVGFRPCQVHDQREILDLVQRATRGQLVAIYRPAIDIIKRQSPV